MSKGLQKAQIGLRVREKKFLPMARYHGIKYRLTHCMDYLLSTNNLSGMTRRIELANSVK
jgi:hypothetical protein